MSKPGPRTILIVALALCSGGVLSVFLTSSVIVRKTQNRVYSDLKAIPQNDVGLVLGSMRGTYYFLYRVRAAAKLYQAGKVSHLLVSGDNHMKGYDEPTDMRNALIELGVPPGAVTCDYAGFRTLDSVVRAKKVFDLSKMTIISQKFHNHRALFIADHFDIDAVAFNAQDAPTRYRRKEMLREYPARVLALADLYILNTQPKFLGKKETILPAPP